MLSLACFGGDIFPCLQNLILSWVQNYVNAGRYLAILLSLRDPTKAHAMWEFAAHFRGTALLPSYTYSLSLLFGFVGKLVYPFPPPPPACSPTRWRRQKPGRRCWTECWSSSAFLSPHFRRFFPLTRDKSVCDLGQNKKGVERKENGEKRKPSWLTFPRL